MFQSGCQGAALFLGQWLALLLETLQRIEVSVRDDEVTVSVVAVAFGCTALCDPLAKCSQVNGVGGVEISVSPFRICVTVVSCSSSVMRFPLDCRYYTIAWTV